MSHILAIDQGTTSSRAIVFDATLKPVASAQEEFTQHFPRSGWVEHDPEDLWHTTLATCRAALDKSGLTADQIAAGATAVPFHGYGRISLRFNPDMVMPDGLMLPLSSKKLVGTYREGVRK